MVEPTTEKALPQAGQYPEKIQHVGTIEVWTELKDLAIKFGCTSLGEGAPNLLPPKFLRDDMVAAIEAGHNQYCRSFGHPLFVKSIAETYGKLYFDAALGRPIDPMNEVLVSHGANTLLNVTIGALINKGDEMIAFEPHFPTYLDHCEMAGGKPAFVPLRYSREAKTWVYDGSELRAACARPNVKLMVLNTPHNPTGKVFTRKELEEISALLDEFPHIVVIADEVYDFLAFDGREHIPFATVGDNFKRTLTIYSGGKLFSATGWKLGWMIGPAAILKMAAIINNTVFYTGNTPGQVAMASSIKKAFEPFTDNGHEGLTYAQSVNHDFAKNRDYLVEALAAPTAYPMVPVECEGGYFLMADISACRDLVPAKYFANHEYLDEGERVAVNKVNLPDGSVPLDVAFCRWMACEKKLAMMPNSFFYAKGSAGMSENFIRMAICKSFDSVKAGAAMFTK